MQTTLLSLLLVTVVLGGGASWMTGRAIALTWKPLWMLLLYMVPLTLAVRFFHYALAHEPLLAPVDMLIDYCVLAAIGALSHQIAATDLKVRQYPWLYRRTSPVTATPIENS